MSEGWLTRLRTWFTPSAPVPDCHARWHDCPNCTRAYPAGGAACPACGADGQGRGGRVTLDETTRQTIARLGGMSGAWILVSEGDAVLCCERGVLRARADGGLLWASRDLGRVDDVELRGGKVWVTTEDGEVCVALDDGQPA